MTKVGVNKSRLGGVVSGLSSSKVSACNMLIKESAEARMGGMIEQSLLKQISSLHLNQGGRSLVFSNTGKVLPNALPSALPEIISNLQS